MSGVSVADDRCKCVFSIEGETYTFAVALGNDRGLGPRTVAGRNVTLRDRVPDPPRSVVAGDAYTSERPV